MNYKNDEYGSDEHGSDEYGSYYDRMVKKIRSTHVFVVLGTKNYLESLINKDVEILTQIKIATELKKPFFIVVDNRLSDKDIKYIINYFSDNNIIKIMTIDIEKSEDTLKLADEIKRLAKEHAGSDENVKIITPYSEDEDSKKDEDNKNKK